MLGILFLIAGLVTMVVGAGGNFGFNVGFVHFGLAGFGVALIGIAIGSWLYDIERTIGIIPYTIMVVFLSGLITWMLTVIGLGPQIIPHLVSVGPYGPAPPPPVTNSTSTVTNNYGNQTGPPPGFPRFPTDPLGLTSWYQSNPNLANTILEAVFVTLVIVVASVIFLRYQLGD